MPQRLHTLAAVLLLAAAPALAQEAAPPPGTVPSEEPTEPGTGGRVDERGTWSFTLENDLFGDADRDYTNGVRVDYITPRNNLTAFGRLAKRGLYGWFSDAPDWYEYYAAGQNMYTPPDISIRARQPDERPYAGFLYVGGGVVADRGDRLDTLALELGVVGPASLAGETQTLVHEILGVQEPKGWDNQLDNEFGVRLIYERKWRYGATLVPFLGLQADVIPHAGLALGNVDTHAAIGGTVRLGQDLRDDYGPPRVQPAVSSPGFFRNEDGFSWYVFAGAEGRAVGRNIFLEGNTFGGVDGVEPRRLVADVQAGVTLQLGRTELSFTQVLRTEEYDGQGDPSLFGSVNLRTRF